LALRPDVGGVARSQVCGVCFAFATDDAAELNAHSEACFALAAQREAGAAPAAEAHFRRFLAHRALPLIQSSAVLLTLTSLGTSVRMALALTSPRWARTSSALGYLPMLHSVSRNGPPPIAAQQLAANAEAVARSIIRLVLPLFALVRLPVMLALFVCSTSPSWREWCVPAAHCYAAPRPRAALLGVFATRPRLGQPWRRAARALRPPSSAAQCSLLRLWHAGALRFPTPKHSSPASPAREARPRVPCRCTGRSRASQRGAGRAPLGTT